MATGDPFLDAIIDALVDGPKDHNQIIRAMDPKLRATGTQVNSYLYKHKGRFFHPDRDAHDGLTIWTLSGPLQRKRANERDARSHGEA